MLEDMGFMLSLLHILTAHLVCRGVMYNSQDKHSCRDRGIPRESAHLAIRPFEEVPQSVTWDPPSTRGM